MSLRIEATPSAGIAATSVTWTATSADAPTIVSWRRPTSPIPMTLPASRRLGWMVARRTSMIRVAFSSTTPWATMFPYWPSAIQSRMPRARLANRFFAICDAPVVLRIGGLQQLHRDEGHGRGDGRR